METVSAGNKGYSADILVVTYNHVKEIADNLKFRILIVSIALKLSLYFGFHTFTTSVNNTTFDLVIWYIKIKIVEPLISLFWTWGIVVGSFKTWCLCPSIRRKKKRFTMNYQNSTKMVTSMAAITHEHSILVQFIQCLR